MKALYAGTRVCTSFPVTQLGCSEIMTYMNQQPFDTTTDCQLTTARTTQLEKPLVAFYLYRVKLLDQADSTFVTRSVREVLVPSLGLLRNAKVVVPASRGVSWPHARLVSGGSWGGQCVLLTQYQHKAALGQDGTAKCCCSKRLCKDHPSFAR